MKFLPQYPLPPEIAIPRNPHLLKGRSDSLFFCLLFTANTIVPSLQL